MKMANGGGGENGEWRREMKTSIIGSENVHSLRIKRREYQRNGIWR
jgi:hypothetical protein